MARGVAHLAERPPLDTMFPTRLFQERHAYSELHGDVGQRLVEAGA